MIDTIFTVVLAAVLVYPIIAIIYIIYKQEKHADALEELRELLRRLIKK